MDRKLTSAWTIAKLRIAYYAVELTAVAMMLVAMVVSLGMVLVFFHWVR